MNVALTGHTRGLGKTIHDYLFHENHHVQGFSLSTGCDLRDYTQDGYMIDSVRSCDWFVNCAHPDYCQTQILYRLLKQDYQGKILNIGSPVVGGHVDRIKIKSKWILDCQVPSNT